MNDLEKTLLMIVEAQHLSLLAIVQALEAGGVTTVDEITRHLEKLNTGTGEGSNVIVEGIVDAMRQHMM